MHGRLGVLQPRWTPHSYVFWKACWRRFRYDQIKDGKTTFNATGGSLVNDPNLPLAQIWERRNGKLQFAIRDRLNPTSDWWGGLAWGPDSHSIVAAHFLGFLDVEARKWFAVPGIWSDSVLSFSPDGRFLLARRNAEATVLELTSPETPVDGQSEQIEVRTLSPDGKETVATATRVDCRPAPMIQLTGHAGPLTAATFCDGSQQIVTTSDDRTARIWQTQSGQLAHVLRGHLRRVNAAAFSPDGRWVVTASDDHAARIWDTSSGKEFFTLTGHKGPIRTVVFSPDGDHLLTASDDGTARLWPVDPLPVAVRRKTRELTPEERQLYGIDRPN